MRKEIRAFLYSKEILTLLTLTDRKTYEGYPGTRMTDIYVTRHCRFRITEDAQVYEIETTPGAIVKTKRKVNRFPNTYEIMTLQKKFISEGVLGDEKFGLEDIQVIVHGQIIAKLLTFEIESVRYTPEEVNQLLLEIYPESDHEVVEEGLFDFIHRKYL